MGDIPTETGIDSPCVHRLRGRTVRPSSKSERQKKTTNSKRQKMSNSELQLSSDNMDQLLKRMDMLHEQTQARMAEMIESCKKDINVNL